MNRDELVKECANRFSLITEKKLELLADGTHSPCWFIWYGRKCVGVLRFVDEKPVVSQTQVWCCDKLELFIEKIRLMERANEQ